MTSLLLVLSAALAQDVPADSVEETPADATSEEEVAPGPDRSKPPEVIPATPLELADPEVHKISDAVEVRLVNLPGVRKVEIAITSRRGTLDIDGWPSSAGRAMGELMDIATLTRDPQDIEVLSTIHDLAVYSSTTSTHEQAVYLEAPRTDLEVGLDLLSDTVREPAYPGKEAKRYRKEDAFYWLAIAPSDMGSLASNARRFSWYDAEHPFGARRELTELKDVKPKGLLDRHSRLWAEGPIDVMVVGDVTWADVEAPLTAMLADLGTPGERLHAPVHEGIDASKIVAVNLAGSEQASIRARLAGPRFDHADRDIAALVDFALGGHFLSRLNRNLREDKGYTYGSGSNLSSGRSSGTWDIGVDVKAENVVSAIGEIEIEIAKLVESGVEASEVESAVGERIQGWNRTRLTASTGFNRYQGLWDDEETPTESRERLLAIREVPVAETQRVAAEWLGADAPRLWVVVGDKDALEGPLAEIGLPVEWIEPSEAVLGSF
ncbi:MAG: insulinase family protein [Proteobacteria bacterium]|nr:insulinase family protein [Pseudomonadota bacterium]